jgi:hypothetical protein
MYIRSVNVQCLYIVTRMYVYSQSIIFFLILSFIIIYLFSRVEILYCSMGCIKFSRSIFSSQRNLLMYDNEWVSLLCTAKQARWVDANRRSWWKGHKLEWPPCSWCSCHFTIYRFVSQILSLHDIIMINQWIIHFL